MNPPLGSGSGPHFAVEVSYMCVQVPCVVVDDTAAAAAKAEGLGGKVLVPVQSAPSGLTFAHLLDPQGNHIGIYTPPAGEDV